MDVATGKSSQSRNELFDRYEAFLFDLDGTLVDTMPLHYAAYADVLRRRGLDLAREVYMSLVGAPARDAIPRFLAACGQADAREEDVLGIHGEKKAALAELLRTRKPLRLPCAALLETAKGRKRLALVTSGNRQGVAAIVSAMGWEDTFDAVVTGDDVASGKPGPEPFAMAARMLGVDPGLCLAFEDTADGLASARAAGMDAIDVTRAQFT